MSSIVVSGDTSGAVTISAPAVAGTTTLTLPSTSGTVLTTASSTGISGSAISSGTVAEAYGGTGTNTGYYGFKNRIINGAMVIDQRNAGASGTANGYTVDRWQYFGSQASKGTWQQNAGSVTPPAGFKNYWGFTSSSAYTVGAAENFQVAQYIEGYNAADLGWGASGASTVTLSFWVRSSLTGTFGGVLANAGVSRAYPFTYTINSANTWEQKSITITGDTSGTWNTTTGVGIQVNFGLGVGSTYSTTAGSWAAGLYLSATGATSVVGTNGATFYITGVQLEKGSTATSFDYRPYGTELQLCQRYFEIVGQTENSILFQTYAGGATTAQQRSMVTHKVTKRASPTTTINGTWTYSNASSLYVPATGVDATRVEWSASGSGINFVYNLNVGANILVSAEL